MFSFRVLTILKFLFIPAPQLMDKRVEVGVGTIIIDADPVVDWRMPILLKLRFLLGSGFIFIRIRRVVPALFGLFVRHGRGSPDIKFI